MARGWRSPKCNRDTPDSGPRVHILGPAAKKSTDKITTRIHDLLQGANCAPLLWDPFDHSEGRFSLNVKKSEKNSRNGFPGPPAARKRV